MKQLPRTWLNGVEHTEISVYDRGLAYGDGFFSTILVESGQLLNWSGHWQRIVESCQRLNFLPIDEQGLLAIIKGSFTELEADVARLVLKIMITRGSGGRGYQPPEQSVPTVIVQWNLAPPIGDEGLKLHLCQTQAGINPDIAGLKHLNRLENVLARQELAVKGWQEGLMLNALDKVVSATQANLFVIKDKQVITPLLNHSGVNGSVRRSLSQLLGREGWQFSEQDLKIQDIETADEVFVTNAVRGVVAVSEFITGQTKVSFTSQKIQTIASLWREYQSKTVLNLKD